jgi:hypothetical protein
MKKRNLVTPLLALILIFLGSSVSAQMLQYFNPNDKSSLNKFETSKDTDVTFDGLKVRMGGDFALQFQAISQINAGDSLPELGNNFSLPTANLNIDVQLADGLRMHLRTYLSSRHHSESWVKGGYIQMDNLNFISDGFLSGLMDVATLKFGMDEINYGDTHFRRSDNARAILNPFVGNYIMDSFTTEPYGELTIQTNGVIVVLGTTNGRLNQSPTPGDDGLVFYGKLGYDKQINDDLRVRFTGSFYNSSDKGTRDYLYGGDRAGSRYYGILTGGDFDGRYNPRFAYLNAFQLNPFIKFQGLEVFGVFEVMNNGDDATGGGFTQIGAEALYRLGSEENFYLGGRYNSVSGEIADGADTREISRLNVGGGWFLTNNVVTKLEYVSQKYSGDWAGSELTGAEFNGLVIEATISF